MSEEKKIKKSSEGTIKVKTLEDDNGYTEIVLEITDNASREVLKHLTSLILSKHPPAHQTVIEKESYREVRIKIPSKKKEKEERQKLFATYPYPPSGTGF